MENKVKVWLARDKDGELFVYSDIPIRCKNHWGYPTCFYIDKSMFPSIKWEDDEPTEAYITLTEPKEQPKQEQTQPKQEKAIDWEQRRYEIAKDLYVRWRDMDTKWAVHATDSLINELKNKNK